jgi:hypothetical protein
MLKKTKIALAAALFFGSASVALASAGENAEGGFDTLSNGQSAEAPRPAVQGYNGGNAYGYQDLNRTTSQHHASQNPTR